MMGRGLLVIVKMQTAQGLILKTQTDLGCVIHIHFQVAQVGGETPDGFDPANQPRKIIERMTLRAYHAAAQVGTRRIAQAIVFPWMPGGQVLSKMDTGRDDPP